jgi:hypothetical protein
VADAAPPPPDAGALDVPCASDEACGFDPGRARCVVDARANRQPEIVDQGILCYCDAGRCATLQVPPVPCESDAACAVAREPRAHPVAADAVHAHGPKNPCREANREIALSAVCEQTNLCTLRRHTCRRR